MMSLPKSCDELGIGGVALELLDEKLGLEDVDAHAAQRLIGLAGHWRRLSRLLQEGEDGVFFVDVHDAEAFGLLERGFEAAHRHVGLRLDVLLEHFLVVHLVDVIAGEHHHVLRRVALDDVDVLIDRVGGAEIPHRLGDALRSRQNVEALVSLRTEEVPSVLQMSDQAMSLVLRGDGDAVDAGVERVRQDEIDDARFAAEVDGGLDAAVGQFHQASATPARQHIGHRLACVGRASVRDPCRIPGVHTLLLQTLARFALLAELGLTSPDK